MENDKLLETARSLKPDPPRSKLDECAEIVWELRRKRKRICTIAAFLSEHGVRVGKSTVARWLKTHPIPKSATPNRTTQTSSAPQPRRQPLDDEARDFFKTPDENYENNQPKLWNQPD
jgi:hypothetical protein